MCLKFKNIDFKFGTIYKMSGISVALQQKLQRYFQEYQQSLNLDVQKITGELKKWDDISPKELLMKNIDEQATYADYVCRKISQDNVKDELKQMISAEIPNFDTIETCAIGNYALLVQTFGNNEMITKWLSDCKDASKKKKKLIKRIVHVYNNDLHPYKLYIIFFCKYIDQFQFSCNFGPIFFYCG